MNFISELINVKLLSKKVVYQCLKFLWDRVEIHNNNLVVVVNDSNKDLKTLEYHLNMEAIVIILDKFGTLINLYDETIKREDLVEANNMIDEYLEKLNDVVKTRNLPGFVKYKIINLIEKKNNKWEESQIDQSRKIKSIKQVEEEFDKEKQASSNGREADLGDVQ